MFRGSLFQKSSVDDFIVSLRKKMVAEIDRIPRDDIVTADVDQLSAQFMERFVVACPILGEDISYDEPPFTAGDELVSINVYVPFTGEAQLFHCSGRSAPIITQEVEVRPAQLVIPIRIERHRILEIPEMIRALIKRISEEGLGPISHQLQFFNPDLKQRAAQRIQERKNEIDSHVRTLGELHRSGFSVRRRDDGGEKVIVPVKPKLIAVQAKLTPSNPEPELPLADYDEILNVIQAMAKVYERSPSVFREMEEEHLRTILLVGLNGVFRGQATGETFNGEGKNDILIRVNDANIFIAECLFWDGQEKFRKKLTDQLFRYATWRDSKLAAIVFNRKKDFAGVVQKMKEVTAGLANRLAEMPYAAPSSCRHRFRRQDDHARQFILTCLAFEVPA
jgi:hypothetical protein